MLQERNIKLEKAINESTVNGKLNKEKILEILKNEDFDDQYYPNDINCELF